MRIHNLQTTNYTQNVAFRQLKKCWAPISRSINTNKKNIDSKMAPNMSFPSTRFRLSAIKAGCIKFGTI